MRITARVTPAKAGVQVPSFRQFFATCRVWIPAFAGMTDMGNY